MLLTQSRAEPMERYAITDLPYVRRAVRIN